MNFAIENQFNSIMSIHSVIQPNAKPTQHLLQWSIDYAILFCLKFTSIDLTQPFNVPLRFFFLFLIFQQLWHISHERLSCLLQDKTCCEPNRNTPLLPAGLTCEILSEAWGVCYSSYTSWRRCSKYWVVWHCLLPRWSHSQGITLGFLDQSLVGLIKVGTDNRLIG